MCSHILLKECFKSGDTKTEAQCSCSLPQKPKEIFSVTRKVWWLENRRAQNPKRRKWISEQSPVRCRGASSRNSMESVSKQKLHRRHKNLRKFTETVAQAQKLLIRTIYLASIVKNYHGIIEQLHFISAETSGIAERAVRPIKEETSTVLLQSGSDDKW